jgi:DNA-binding NarL/FixJ family response regulator
MTRILLLPDDVPLNLIETSLSVEELRALLKSAASSTLPEHSPAVRHLTRRQRQVLHLLIQGHNPKTIARRMGISYRTVSHHIQRLRHDLNISNPLSALLSAYIANGKLDSPNNPEGENK